MRLIRLRPLLQHRRTTTPVTGGTRRKEKTMPKLLVVEASPRGQYSISRNLATKFVADWKAAHPDGEVVERDLAKVDLPYVNLPWLGASLTPIEAHTAEMKEVLAVSNELVDELLAADHLAISTPVYNYNIPANLKSWVDHIVRKGRTLGMTGEGLVQGKHCTVLMASGSVYTEGSPIRDRDIATMYLRLILKVIGTEDVTFVAARQQSGGHGPAIPSRLSCSL